MSSMNTHSLSPPDAEAGEQAADLSRMSAGKWVNAAVMFTDAVLGHRNRCCVRCASRGTGADAVASTRSGYSCGKGQVCVCLIDPGTVFPGAA